MLLLLGLLLCCPALCLAAPMPTSTGKACPASSLLLEALTRVQELKEKGSSELTPLNTTMEAEGNIMNYLEGAIQVLNSSKDSSVDTLLAQLREIQAYGKRCSGWMEQDWEPVEEYDFFSNLENLLRFLNHNALPEETA